MAKEINSNNWYPSNNDHNIKLFNRFGEDMSAVDINRSCEWLNKEKISPKVNITKIEYFKLKKYLSENK